MTTRKKTTKKKTAKKTARKTTRKPSSRKKITPRKQKRGLAGVDVLLGLGAKEVAPLVRQVEEVGGAAIGAYREPFSGRPLLLASLPLNAVQPTPFQRDLSPTHTKRR